MNFFKAGVLAVALLCTACSSHNLYKDIEVYAKADASADMSDYKTYAWMGSAGVLRDKPSNFRMLELGLGRELRNKVNETMVNKGFEQNILNPDLGLYYAIGIEPKTESENNTQDDSLEGRLIVMLVDIETKKTVWVSTTKAEVKENRKENEVLSRIEYTIAEMFKSLPIRK